MSKRLETLRGDLRFNQTQAKWITRDLDAINARIKLINKEITKLENFAEFDVD